MPGFILFSLSSLCFIFYHCLLFFLLFLEFRLGGDSFHGYLGILFFFLFRFSFCSLSIFFLLHLLHHGETAVRPSLLCLFFLPSSIHPRTSPFFGFLPSLVMMRLLFRRRIRYLRPAGSNACSFVLFLLFLLFFHPFSLCVLVNSARARVRVVVAAAYVGPVCRHRGKIFSQSSLLAVPSPYLSFFFPLSIVVVGVDDRFPWPPCFSLHLSLDSDLYRSQYNRCTNINIQEKQTMINNDCKNKQTIAYNDEVAFLACLLILEIVRVFVCE